MVVNRRKKNSRHRGSWTHGYGEKKKHRGAGHRGGRGNAGSGKRGDAKKPRYWKIKKFVGKSGFTNPHPTKVNTITIAILNKSIQELVASGAAQKAGKGYAVDCTKLGINKLLGTGTPAFAFQITVASATPGAVQKVEAAGGKVVVGKQEDIKEEKVVKEESETKKGASDVNEKSS